MRRPRQIPFAAQIALLYAGFLLVVLVLMGVFELSLPAAGIGAALVMLGPTLIVVGRHEGIGR